MQLLQSDVLCVLFFYPVFVPSFENAVHSETIVHERRVVHSQPVYAIADLSSLILRKKQQFVGTLYELFSLWPQLRDCFDLVKHFLVFESKDDYFVLEDSKLEDAVEP